MIWDSQKAPAAGGAPAVPGAADHERNSMPNVVTERPFLAGVLRGRPLAAYGLGLGLALLALALRLGLGDRLPPGFPFLTFFPAIIVTAYLGGTGPGLVSAAVSLVAAGWYLIPPERSLVIDAGKAMALAFFLIVAAVDIFIIDGMQRALDRLHEERRLTARLYEQQRNLFQELQHRVANNMGFISGLLRLQKRRIAEDPDSVAAAFDEAVARIETMSRVHRRLYDPAAANQALEAHLQSMCDELLAATGVNGVDCRVELPAMRIDLERLLPLSLLVAEVVTNSLKHGFAGRTAGTIRVGLEAGEDGERVLFIRDDGVGLPGGHDPGGGSGLGMRIVHGLAAQIGGRISMASDGGTVTRVTLPA